MSKRVKISGPKAKRPIDKRIITLSQNMDNSQDNVTLFTCTFPCTLLGLRVNIASEISTVNTNWGLAVISVVQDGTTPGAIDLTTGNSSYEPEQNVMWGGVFPGYAVHVQAAWYPDVIKTKRKMKVGDSLVLSCLGAGANVQVLRGMITYFIMT